MSPRDERQYDHAPNGHTTSTKAGKGQHDENNDTFVETFHLFDEQETNTDDDQPNISLSKKQHSEQSSENYHEDPSVPPAYLMTAILAGLYELPPDHILRYQTGWGRRIRYDPNKLQRQRPNFIPLKHAWAGDDSLRLECMTLSRCFFDKADDGRASKMADFHIYRVCLEDGSKLNQDLQTLALLKEQEQPIGLDVSNAGGSWHGPPNFFDPVNSNNHHEPNPQRRLHRIVTAAMTAVEDDLGSCFADLEPDPASIECWVNISRSGAWNRLHTHQGSAWSGVDYVDAGSSTDPTSYGGSLVLKPTPHPKEDTTFQDDRELHRFSNWRLVADSDGTTADSCTYLDLRPIAGQMIIFPSWLHHCVLPTRALVSAAPRVSIAFNVNFKAKHQ